jgi:hypothetical protein
MDVHVQAAITEGLRVRGVDVLTAQEDNARRLNDAELLTHTTELGRVLFSRDDDLLREAARRQRSGESFAGLVYAHQLDVGFGRCIDDLELLATVLDPDDFGDRVEYLPLKVDHATLARNCIGILIRWRGSPIVGGNFS